MGNVLNSRLNWDYFCLEVYVSDPEHPAAEIQTHLNTNAAEGWRWCQTEQFLKGAYMITFEREWEEDNLGY